MTSVTPALTLFVAVKMRFKIGANTPRATRTCTRKRTRGMSRGATACDSLGFLPEETWPATSEAAERRQVADCLEIDLPGFCRCKLLSCC